MTKVLFAAAMALLPRFIGGSSVEAGRLLILASVYAGIAVLAYLGVIPVRAQRIIDLAFAATLLSHGWLQSFPAGNHSTEIGLYIVFGAGALAWSLSRAEQGISGGTAMNHEQAR